MKLGHISIILGTLMLLAGFSATAQDKVEYNGSALDGVDFASYTTYGWLPFMDSMHTGQFDSDKVDLYITEAVDREMQKRGFTIDNEAPEIYIQYMIALDNTVKTETKATYGAPNVGVGMGFGRGGNMCIAVYIASCINLQANTNR